MAKHTIKESAKLTGISRKTIYKHISNGKLSSHIDINGTKVVETSELIRVYGELENAENGVENAPENAETLPENGTLIRELVDAVKHLTGELSAIKQELRERPRLTHNPITTLTTASPTEGSSPVVNATESTRDVIKRLTAELGRRPTAAELGKALKEKKATNAV